MIVRFEVVGAFAAVSLLFGQDVAYTLQSRSVYDAARVIAPDEFNETRLLQTLREFARSEGVEHTLARLIVGVSQRDLAAAINAYLPPKLPNPMLLRAQQDSPTVAQVLCFGKQATAWVRRGKTVHRYQITGQRDSRSLIIEGVETTLVGFRLRPGDGEPHPLADRVWLYLETQALPDLRKADAIRGQLEAQLGIQTYLIIRRDSFFFDYDGPLFDAFEIPQPQISNEEFLVRPYIVCRPSGTSVPCELRTLR